MAAPEASSFKMLLTLGLAGMISGLVLVGIYTVTAPRIERNRAEALDRAVYQVLPGAVRKETSEPNAEGDVVYAGFDAEGARIGYAIPAEGAGFQDTIRLLYGVNLERRRVVGMRVLESRETPGLGDKIFKDLDFVAEFDDLAIDPAIEAVPKGTAAEAWQVDAITGATISSKAIVRIINDGNERGLEELH